MNQLYFIRNRGRVLGPFSVDRLNSLRARGQFSRVHEVSVDRVNWFPGSSLDHLFASESAKAPAGNAGPSPGEIASDSAAGPGLGQPANITDASSESVRDQSRERQSWIPLSFGFLVTVVVFVFLTGTNKSATSIERVLAQDATTHNGAASVAAVVRNMRGIDLSGCPSDFRGAYVAHVHAWESMAEVEQAGIMLKADSESAGAFMESFIRGFLGDPFGKANEINTAHNQLQQRALTVQQQIRETFHRVEEIAVARGARLPKKQ